MKIRSSMLPGYQDCARRAAAKQYASLVLAAGFEVRKLKPSIGAAVGTAAHAVAEGILRARMEGRELQVKQAMEPALEGFREEIREGAEWDNTTPNLDTAVYQIGRISMAYAHGLPQDGQVVAVELSIKADAGDGFELSGHVDRVDMTEAGAFIRDLKTGYVQRPYVQQLGCYSLLYRANYPDPVAAVGVDFVQRTPRTRPQADPEHHAYRVDLAERAAWSVIQRIKEDVTRFAKSGNPEMFACNPMSMMCGPKYCPAHGTTFCEITSN